MFITCSNFKNYFYFKRIFFLKITLFSILFENISFINKFFEHFKF